MDKMFRIGDFCFRIISELSHAAPEHFLQFAVEMGKPEYIYHLREVQSLPVLDGKRIAHRFHDIVLSFAAGVMLAAAILGLILPGIEKGNLAGQAQPDCLLPGGRRTAVRPGDPGRSAGPLCA